MIVKIPSGFITYFANKTKDIGYTWKLLGSFSDAERDWFSTCTCYVIYKMDTPSFLCKQHQVLVCFWKRILGLLFLCCATSMEFCLWEASFLLIFHYLNFITGQWTNKLQQHMTLTSRIAAQRHLLSLLRLALPINTWSKFASSISPKDTE